MATEAQIRAALNTANSNASGDLVYPRNWDQLCQAFVYQVCRLFGKATKVYPSADAARLASGALNKDANKAPGGAIHYWTQNHVGIALPGNNGRVLMGSTKINSSWVPNGTAGETTVAAYSSRTGLTYAGWSLKNGVNYVSITAPVVTLKPNQRQALTTSAARLRADKRVASSQVGTVAAGAIADFDGWAYGDAVSGVTVWFATAPNAQGVRLWSWAGGYTDKTTHDLKDLNPKVFTVTFDVAGGTGTYPDQSVTEGKLATEPTEDPTREGHTFLGWFAADNIQFDFAKPIVANTPLHAGWELVPVVVPEPEPEPEPDPDWPHPPVEPTDPGDETPNWFVRFLTGLIDFFKSFIGRS